MKRTIIDRYDGPTTLAIDVSAHQGTIDWPRVAGGEATLDGHSQGRVRLAIVRTGDGRQTRASSKPDPMAVRNLRGAHEAGIPSAAYHYIRGDHPADVQVDVILEVLAVAGVPCAFVALDLEGRPDNPKTHEDEGSGAWQELDDDPRPDTLTVLRCLAEMRELLERRGHRVLVYTGVAWNFYVAQSAEAAVRAEAARWADIELWTPYYTSGAYPAMPVDAQGRAAPWSSWTLWQYSSKGRVPGISAAVDLNRFRGGEEQLAAWLAPQRPAESPRAAVVRELEALRATYAGEPAIARELDETIGRLARCV